MSVPSYNSEAWGESNEQRVWRIVAHAPLTSLWQLNGASIKYIALRTGKALLADRVFGRAAELGFYFLFSIFPGLFCAAAMLGLAARSAPQIYTKLLEYLALVVPTSALGMVLHIFTQTTAAANSGKITLSLLGAIWSASVGVSAIQDTLNDVYKMEDSRSYLGARIKAIGLTLLSTALITLGLASLFGGDFVATSVEHHIAGGAVAMLAAAVVRIIFWAISILLLILVFAVIYYWAPDWRARRWRWLTPGSVIGIGGWIVASFGLRLYLHFFNTYSVTYGSLGAVIILLTWLYITGLMLLAGGELNSEIEAAAVEKRLAEHAENTPRPRAA